MLFDDKERTRIAPKTPGEDDFSFYDFPGVLRNSRSIAISSTAGSPNCPRTSYAEMSAFGTKQTSSEVGSMSPKGAFIANQATTSRR